MPDSAVQLPPPPDEPVSGSSPRPALPKPPRRHRHPGTRAARRSLVGATTHGCRLSVMCTQLPRHAPLASFKLAPAVSLSHVHAYGARYILYLHAEPVCAAGSSWENQCQFEVPALPQKTCQWQCLRTSRGFQSFTMVHCSARCARLARELNNCLAVKPLSYCTVLERAARRCRASCSRCASFKVLRALCTWQLETPASGRRPMTAMLPWMLRRAFLRNRNR